MRLQLLLETIRHAEVEKAEAHTYLRSTNLNNPVIGFGLDDISVSAFDEFGRLWGSVTLLDTTEDNPVQPFN